MKQRVTDSLFKLRANIRPLMIAYFFCESDEKSLSRIIQLACTQWGGYRHLIVPIRREENSIDEIHKHLISLHEPDWFVFFRGGDFLNDNITNQLQRQLSNIFPYRMIKIQDGDSFEQTDRTLHTLHAIPDDVRFKEKLTVSQLILEDSHLMSQAIYGNIFPGQEEFYHRSFHSVDYKDISLNSEEFWKSQLNISPFDSVINLTSYGFYSYKVRGWGFLFDHMDIALVDPKSTKDIVMFWNIRAIREAVNFKQRIPPFRQTLCLPIDLLETANNIENLFTTVKDTLFFPGRTTNLDIRFYCYTKEMTTRAENAVSSLPILQKFKEDKITGNTLYLGEDQKSLQTVEDRPLSYIFSRLVTPDNYYEGVSGSKIQLINFEFGENEIYIEPPSDFQSQLNGTIALDLECEIWGRYPHNRQVAEKIKRDSWFSRYGLSMAIDSTSKPHFQKLTIPLEREAIKLFFQGKGYEIRPSKVEKYSTAVIQLLGGINNCEILASEATWNLLDTLALKSTKKVAQRIIKEIGLKENDVEDIIGILDDFEMPLELKGVPRTIDQLNDNHKLDLPKEKLIELIDSLSRRQILKRGFYLSCPNCGTPDWYPLDNISEILTCSGCAHKFFLPIYEQNNPSNAMQWRFRLNTLVNRAVDQDVLPGIVATYHLTSKHPLSSYIHGLEIWKNGQAITDLDFVFVTGGDVFVGECKSGSTISDKDCRTARLAAELGVGKFYYCTVAEFNEESLEKIDLLKTEISKIYQTEILLIEKLEMLTFQSDNP